MSRPRPARALAAGFIAAVAALALAGCATGGGTGATSTPIEATAPTEDGVVTNFLELRVGDCFSIPSNLQEGEALRYSSCEVPHLFEAFASSELPDGPFPGTNEVDAQAGAACEAAFVEFVGESWTTSDFDYQYIVPSQRTWDELGDRQLMCMVTSLNGLPWTGSARDAGR